jgi:hypothetical protein
MPASLVTVVHRNRDAGRIRCSVIRRSRDRRPADHLIIAACATAIGGAAIICHDAPY